MAVPWASNQALASQEPRGRRSSEVRRQCKEQRGAPESRTRDSPRAFCWASSFASGCRKHPSPGPGPLGAEATRVFPSLTTRGLFCS